MKNFTYLLIGVLALTFSQVSYADPLLLEGVGTEQTSGSLSDGSDQINAFPDEYGPYDEYFQQQVEEAIALSEQMMFDPLGDYVQAGDDGSVEVSYFEEGEEISLVEMLEIEKKEAIRRVTTDLVAAYQSAIDLAVAQKRPPKMIERAKELFSEMKKKIDEYKTQLDNNDIKAEEYFNLSKKAAKDILPEFAPVWYAYVIEKTAIRLRDIFLKGNDDAELKKAAEDILKAYTKKVKDLIAKLDKQYLDGTLTLQQCKAEVDKLIFDKKTGWNKQYVSDILKAVEKYRKDRQEMIDQTLDDPMTDII